MLSILKYFLRRLTALALSFLGITAIIFACLSLFPPEERASLYLSPNIRNPETKERLVAQVIEAHHFDDPFYLVWFGFAWSLLGDELNTWLNPRERY